MEAESYSETSVNFYNKIQLLEMCVETKIWSYETEETIFKTNDA